MSTDALRAQIRAQVRTALDKHGAAAAGTPPAATGGAHTTGEAVVIPLRLGGAQDTAALTQLFQRLSASPALLQMADAGLLRFDLRVDASAIRSVAQAPTPAPTPPGGATAMAATTAIDPATCCASCKAGQSCSCDGDGGAHHGHPAPASVPVLKGVVGEKQIKTLAADVKRVRLDPGAVMTPLGKEALRKRGITIDQGATP